MSDGEKRRKLRQFRDRALLVERLAFSDLLRVFTRWRDSVSAFGRANSAFEHFEGLQSPYARQALGIKEPMKDSSFVFSRWALSREIQNLLRRGCVLYDLRQASPFEQEAAQ